MFRRCEKTTAFWNFAVPGMEEIRIEVPGRFNLVLNYILAEASSISPEGSMNATFDAKEWLVDNGAAEAVNKGVACLTETRGFTSLKAAPIMQGLFIRLECRFMTADQDLTDALFNRFADLLAVIRKTTEPPINLPFPEFTRTTVFVDEGKQIPFGEFWARKHPYYRNVR